MRGLLQILLLSIVGRVAVAEVRGAQGEFHIDQGLVEEIYRDTRESQSEEIAQQETRFGIGISMLKPGTWRFGNDYFKTQYADNVDLLTTVEVSASTQVLSFGKFALLGDAHVGYGYQSGVFAFQSAEGEARTDNVQVHRVPLSVEARFQFHQPGFPVRPFISGGLGVQWTHQIGTLDGFSQGFLTPFAFFRPGIVLFAPEGKSVSWFGGVRVSGILLSQFGTDQETKASGVELGIDLVL